MKQYDEETGEYWDIPTGSLILTPEDLAAQQNYKNRRAEAAKRQEELAKYHYRGDETYYFVSSERQIDLSPTDITRLVYLLTYLGYDGVLKTTKRAKMQRADLSELLGVSQDTANRFWNNVRSRYLFENCDGALSVNEQWFKRGKLPKKQYTEYQQFYDNAIRKLYKTAAEGSLKRMGYIFNMLPWINREFNILAENPLETALNKVIPLQITTFCEKTGLNRSNISRWLKQLASIRFQTNNGDERFCCIVYDGRSIEGAKIVVNPSVLYAGKNPNRVKIYKLFFTNN